MKILKTNLEDFKLELKCEETGWANDNILPCGYLLEIDKNDIYKRIINGFTFYGCICINCNSFIEISSDLIPNDIKNKCLNIAKPGSDEYLNLPEEHKEVSNLLFHR